MEKKYMKRTKNSKEIYGINVIWLDGLITYTTKMDQVFLIQVTLEFLVE